MEKIYRPRYKHVINVKEKFDLYKNNLIPECIDNFVEANDAILANCFEDGDDEDFKALEDTISLDHLAMPDDLSVTEFNPLDLNQRNRNAVVEVPNKALKLKSVQFRVESQAGITAQSRLRGFKYNKYKYMCRKIDNESGVCDLTALDDVLLIVRVYEPFNYRRGSNTGSRKPRLNQEFAVLGSQLLSDLRDKIYCQCNLGPFYDLSNDFDSLNSPGEEFKQPAVHEHGPGFFFITDTFYNDTRQSDVDYTTEIRAWIQRQPDIDEMKTALMQETKFEDLNIRLGFPQVYRHHGICEHLFTFADIRLLGGDDSLKRCDYPMLRVVSSSKTKICMICGVKECTFLVINSTAHIYDPAYLCKSCLLMYHYVDGQKQGEFQVYRYYGNRPIVN